MIRLLIETSLHMELSANLQRFSTYFVEVCNDYGNKNPLVLTRSKTRNDSSLITSILRNDQEPNLDLSLLISTTESLIEQ